MPKKEIKLTVNGQPYELWVKPKTLLVEVLRLHLGLTGTKRDVTKRLVVPVPLS